MLIQTHHVYHVYHSMARAQGELVCMQNLVNTRQKRSYSTELSHAAALQYPQGVQELQPPFLQEPPLQH